MPVQVHSSTRFKPFFRSRFFPRTEIPARTVAGAGHDVRGLMALVALAIAWVCTGDVLAQAPTPELERLNFAQAGTSETAAPDASASPWSAPEPWRTDKLYFQFAYYTLHYHYDPIHKQSYLFDSEYHFDETWLGGQWITGIALFQNSFGQFSEYIFGGLQWRPLEEHQPFYVKLSAGPLHGYEGQYKNKVPFNNSGTGLAIIPSVGYCSGRVCGELVLLGANAALFTIGMTVP
jgi:hypothetical protein